MAETDNLKLALPGSNEYVDVEVLNENFRKIDAAVLLALAAAAPYSSEQTYALGAYCTRGGKLYRCTTAISTAEVWTDAHWTETTMGAELVAISIALAKKAAGGFGYGDSISYPFTGDSDGSKFDNAINAFLAEKKDGVFQIKFQSHPFLNTVGCVGTLWTFGDGKYAVLKGVSYFGELVQRTRYDGVWSPWEWLNPPMYLGVEYRTTERYLGNPVYVKAVDFGAMPNNTVKIVTFGDSTTRVISAHGIMNGGYVIPGCTGDSDYPAQEMQIFTEDGGKVGIMTHTDRSGYTAVVIVKYWKTTD